MNHDAKILSFIVLGILMAGSLVGAILKRTVTTEGGQRVVANLVARVNAWWIMSVFIAGALFGGERATIIFFGLASFFALREFITPHTYPAGRSSCSVLGILHHHPTALLDGGGALVWLVSPCSFRCMLSSLFLCGVHWRAIPLTSLSVRPRSNGA